MPKLLLLLLAFPSHWLCRLKWDYEGEDVGEKDERVERVGQCRMEHPRNKGINIRLKP